jgi:SAM-dependent methyltransferase
METSFEQYIKDAYDWCLKGWNSRRYKKDGLKWSHRDSIINQFSVSIMFLDMGTGGGELLSSLPYLQNNAFATESYKPNIPLAKSRFEGLGIKLYGIDDDSNLPFESNMFDLIINKHESFDYVEVYRILKPSGMFIT